MKVRKTMVVMLTAVLLFVIAVPSFAAGGDGGTETDGPAVTGETESPEKPEGTGAGTDQAETESPDPGASDGAEETGEDSDDGAAEEKTDPQELPGTKGTEAGAESILPEEGSTVKYTSAGSHPVKFTVSSGDHTFTGTCATLGVDNAKSGSATVKNISKDSRIYKLVYFYGYQNGWWEGANSSKKATDVLNLNDRNCTENARQCIEALIQRDNMGWDAFWAARKVGGYRMYSTDSFMRAINDLYNNTDVSQITIPKGAEFEIFHGMTSSSKHQDFYVWYYHEAPAVTDGFVKMKKVSADTSITG